MLSVHGHSVILDSWNLFWNSHNVIICYALSYFSRNNQILISLWGTRYDMNDKLGNVPRQHSLFQVLIWIYDQILWGTLQVRKGNICDKTVTIYRNKIWSLNSILNVVQTSTEYKIISKISTVNVLPTHRPILNIKN